MVSDIDKNILFEDICSKIEEGKSLKSLTTGKNKIMSNTRFYKMLEEKENSERYARAKILRAELLFEEILEIADDSSNDTIETEKGPIENREWVNRSRLRVDSRKWYLSKVLPKVYGDKLDIDNKHSGSITLSFDKEDEGIGS